MKRKSRKLCWGMNVNIFKCINKIYLLFLYEMPRWRRLRRCEKCPRTRASYISSGRKMMLRSVQRSRTCPNRATSTLSTCSKKDLPSITPECSAVTAFLSKKFSVKDLHEFASAPPRNFLKLVWFDLHSKCFQKHYRLAWGVNLPSHAVVIKGTEIYDAKHGAFVDIGIWDVLQIFGRAGRPQFDVSILKLKWNFCRIWMSLLFCCAAQYELLDQIPLLKSKN